jgi:hypothetical protein
MEHRKWLVVALLFVREGEGEDLFRECARGRPRPFISVLSSAARARRESQTEASHERANAFELKARFLKALIGDRDRCSD